MAVAIWDHEPTAHELLQSRLNRGWTPTLSELKAGNKVLGYAACVMPPKLTSQS
jgi:hypothetical protein